MYLPFFRDEFLAFFLLGMVFFEPRKKGLYKNVINPPREGGEKERKERKELLLLLHTTAAAFQFPTPPSLLLLSPLSHLSTPIFLRRQERLFEGLFFR